MRKTYWKYHQYINHYDYLATLCPTDERVEDTAHKAKIMGTIGPASRSIEMLENLMAEGMTMGRIMLGKGNYEFDKETIANIRIAAKNHGKKINREFPFFLAVDLAGPDVKVGLVECGFPFMFLKEDSFVKLSTNEKYREACNTEVIFVDYNRLHKVVKINDEIYLNDGAILLIVSEIGGDFVMCRVEQGGKYSSKNNLNFPKVILDMPELTERDWKDVEFAKNEDVDAIIISYTRFPQTIKNVREKLGEAASRKFIIAKVENYEAVNAFEEITKISDAICIGRGDLGINVTIPKLIYHQKKLISLCNIIGRPVLIVAHILNSMEMKKRPQRNEVSDVANCVLDGADALILKNQTTTGKYPLESINTLANVIRNAEKNIWTARIFHDFYSMNTPPVEGGTAMAIAAVDCALRNSSAAILVITRSGRSACLLSKFSPQCFIFGICRNEIVAKKMLMFKGVLPLISESPKTEIFIRDLDDQLQYAIDIGLRENYIRYKQSVICLVPSEASAPFANSMVCVQVLEKRGRILY